MKLLLTYPKLQPRKSISIIEKKSNKLTNNAYIKSNNNYAKLKQQINQN